MPANALASPSLVCLCVHVCVDVHVVCVWVYVWVYVCICVSVGVYMCMCVFVVCLYAHVCMCVFGPLPDVATVYSLCEWGPTYFFSWCLQAKKLELKECLINDMQEKKKAYETFRLTGDLASGGKV